ncbi:unnamed protein product [Natator depressus]
MVGYPYRQGYPGSAGPAPGALQGGYYSRGQYGGGLPPGGPYGSSAPRGPSGPPSGGGAYGHPTSGGALSGAPGGPYAGGPAPGGPYGQLSTNPYGALQPGPYGAPGAPAGNMPPGVDPAAFSWYQTMDADCSGYISIKELKQALVNSNWPAFNDETCLMMINMFDKTKSGWIDIFAFSTLWCFIQQWKNLFQQYDGDRSGSTNLSELQQMDIT